MDIATLVGMLGAIGFVVMAMVLGSSGNVGMFMDTVSVLIVFGKPYSLNVFSNTVNANFSFVVCIASQVSKYLLE